MNHWKTLKSEFLVNAPWLKVEKETVEISEGKVIDDFYTLWQPSWVLILAQTADLKWVLVKQYRHGTAKIETEFPAGIINKNESIKEAALRELQEECGYGPAENFNAEYLGELPVNPDRHKGKFHIVFLENVKKIGNTCFDENEDIETFTADSELIEKMILNGTFTHPLQIAGFYKWQLFLKSK